MIPRFSYFLCRIEEGHCIIRCSLKDAMVVFEPKINREVFVNGQKTVNARNLKHGVSNGEFFCNSDSQLTRLKKKKILRFRW